MELYWVLLVVYVVIGIVYGAVMAAADMNGGNEPGEELVWIPIGIVAWPIVGLIALRKSLKS